MRWRPAAAHTRQPLHDRQEHDDDDDEDKDVFGQIIHIRIPRRNTPEMLAIWTLLKCLDTTTIDSFSLPSTPRGYLVWKPWVY